MEIECNRNYLASSARGKVFNCLNSLSQSIISFGIIGQIREFYENFTAHIPLFYYEKIMQQALSDDIK